MPFKSGHEKRGGRKVGTPNTLTGEAREVARRLLGDAAYQRSLQKRLVRGEAPRVELHLWELAYGKPPAAPEVADPSLDLGAILERISERKRQGLDSHAPHDPRRDPRNRRGSPAPVLNASANHNTDEQQK